MTLARPLELLSPLPQQLWDRAEQVSEVQAEGSEVALPFFDLEITRIRPLGAETMRDDLGNPTGHIHEYSFTLSDGSSRAVRVWLPDNRSEHLIATSGTAFMTTIHGYAGDRSRRIANEAQLAVVQIGAEYSGDPVRKPHHILRLAQAAMDGPSISLAKTAQAEELIISEVCEMHDLPRTQVAHGDSRDSITTLGQTVYASEYGMEVPFIDPKALVLHNRLDSLQDIAKVLHWLGREAVVGSAVLLQQGVEDDLLKLKGTVEVNPAVLAGLFVGTMPALFSGEAGVMARAMPRDVRGYANLYRKDLLCDVENWEETLAQYPNLYVNVVNKAVHAHLLSITAAEKQINRFAELSQQSTVHGNQYDAYDLSYMHKYNLRAGVLQFPESSSMRLASGQ